MADATTKFRDTNGFPGAGIMPQILATGSIGTAPIPLTSPANMFRRMAFLGYTGSGGATTLYNAWVGGASASNGTFSVLPSTAISVFSGSASYGISTQFGSGALFMIDVRLDAIRALNSGVSWIKGIMSVTTASGTGMMIPIGYNPIYQPASFYDANGGFVNQEADMF